MNVVIVVSTCLLGACQYNFPGENISSKAPQSALIGKRYAVTGDGLYAYGVYRNLNERHTDYIDLVPQRIGGPEIAFRKAIPKGTVITIVSAWEESTMFGLARKKYYVVTVQDVDLPSGIPITLGLGDGNEGTDSDLNPALYREIGS